MIDPAYDESYDALSDIEDELESLYGDAWRDVFDESDISALYMESEQESTQRQRLDYAERNGLDALIAALVTKAVLTNERAINAINGRLDGVYDRNYKYMADQLGVGGFGRGAGMNKYTQRAYDKMVNESHLKREMTKEIVNMIKRGDSVLKMSKRIQQLFGRNKTNATLCARTEATRILNVGRLDAFYAAEKLGIKAKKQWVATNDSRTRDSHAAMDGQIVGMHEAFVSGDGNELEYPGDPKAPPEDICNCRCTFVSVQEGI